MRLIVTGRVGQVVTALMARAAERPDITAISIGRPEFDLGDPKSIESGLVALNPDIIVNAAAYTAVDQAEKEPDLADMINGTAAGAVSAAAGQLGIPVVQLSTDYVFDGTKTSPYLETDPTGPVSAYGRSKLLGEKAVAANNPDHVILRTAWVYAPSGKNFVNTMLRLCATRPELSVVGDQQGCPSYAPDIADAIISIAQTLHAEPHRDDLRGIFHLCGGGSTDWASFAEAIFAEAAQRGRGSASVRRITTADYPTPAQRPANSRLDCSKLQRTYGITMPHWRDALTRCMDQIGRHGELAAS